jgi:FlaA1/EpsC-like NDP-sugar epimerase
LGGRDAIPEVASQKKVDEILIAIPSLPDQEMRHLIALCEMTGRRYRVMQSLAKSVLG